MQLARFHENLQEFTDIASLDQLAGLLRKHATALEFEWFVYAVELQDGPPSARLALVDGYPPAWIEHYFREGLLGQDPVMRYCRQHTIPTSWGALSSTQGPARVMTEAADFGLIEGLSAPLHGPRGDLGVLSLATGSEIKSSQERAQRALCYAHVLAGYAHEAIQRILLVESAKHTRPLSARERECLLWVSEGKTSWEIGIILGTSERTVNFHLKNAGAKLGVSNRQHAVAKALLLGLLRGPPVKSDS